MALCEHCGSPLQEESVLLEDGGPSWWVRKCPECDAKARGIVPVRPSRLFAKVEAEGLSRVMQVRMPKRRNLEGPDNTPPLLETMVLLAAMRIVDARRVFEFGTCLGATALNLALNLPEEGRVYTLDLDHPAQRIARQTDSDKGATDFRLSHEMEWNYPGLGEFRSRISDMTGDSTAKSSFPLVDLVWIDGGHDLRTVRSDTRNAFGMAPQCIAWHDYRNWDCPDVTVFLNGLSRDMRLYWIEDTSMVLWFKTVEL